MNILILLLLLLCSFNVNLLQPSRWDKRNICFWWNEGRGIKTRVQGAVCWERPRKPNASSQHVWAKQTTKTTQQKVQVLQPHTPAIPPPLHTHTHKHVYTVYWPLFVTCYIFSWEPVRGFKLAALAASVRPASVHSTLSIPCQLVALRHFLCNTQETSCTPNLPSIPPAAAHLPTQNHQEMAAIPPTRTRTWPITTHLLTKACLASPSFVWQPREDSLAASLSVFLAADTCGQWKY